MLFWFSLCWDLFWVMLIAWMLLCGNLSTLSSSADDAFDREGWVLITGQKLGV